MIFHTTHDMVYQGIKETIEACTDITGLDTVALVVDNDMTLHIDKNSVLERKYEIYKKLHKQFKEIQDKQCTR